MKRKAILLTGIFLGAQLLSAGAALTAESAEQGEEIVILYTNDVHCGVKDFIGYDGLALYKKEMESIHDNVLLVDAGDAIQGDTLGSMTGGADIITLMNSLGYDVAAVGNHEFDYSVNRLVQLAPQLDCGYVCCNFTDRDGNVIFEPYRMIESGGRKIAFVGAVTPHTFVSSTPAFFKNEEGEYIYSFSQEEGAFYEVIQESADAARDEGADFVILLGHLGEVDEGNPEWTAQSVVANTGNIDAVIDAHSHSVTEQMTVKNRDGEDVVITQTGTKLSNIGKMTISADDSIKTELISEVPQPSAEMNIPDGSWFSDESRNGRNVDRAVNDTINSMLGKIENDLSAVSGSTGFDLCVTDPATGKRMIRQCDTNLGDLCADFFRENGSADFGIINGGSIRADISSGDITLKSLFSVFPFLSYPATAEVTGQQILDYLELGAEGSPGESGSFVQVSGLSYEINAGIPSPVQTNVYGELTAVTGERRVRNVRLEDGSPLDPDKTYKIASTDYLIRDGGDGGVFSKNCSDLTVSDEHDFKALGRFIASFPGGVIPSEYSNPYGQGRIKVTGAELPEESTAAAETTVSAEEASTEQTVPEAPAEKGAAATDDSPSSNSGATVDTPTADQTSSGGAVQTGADMIFAASGFVLLAASVLAVWLAGKREERNKEQ